MIYVFASIIFIVFIQVVDKFPATKFRLLTIRPVWIQLPATHGTTTKVISKSQCGKNACLAFLGETNLEKVKVKLGAIGCKHAPTCLDCCVPYRFLQILCLGSN